MQLKENVRHCAHNEGGKTEPVVHAWPYISAPTGSPNVKWQKINQNWIILVVVVYIAQIKVRFKICTYTTQILDDRGYAILYCMVETCAPIFQIHVSSLLSICDCKHKKFKPLNTVCTSWYCTIMIWNNDNGMTTFRLGT